VSKFYWHNNGAMAVYTSTRAPERFKKWYGSKLGDGNGGRIAPHTQRTRSGERHELPPTRIDWCIFASKSDCWWKCFRETWLASCASQVVRRCIPKAYVYHLKVR